MNKYFFFTILSFLLIIPSSFALISINVANVSTSGGGGTPNYWTKSGSLLYPTDITNGLSIEGRVGMGAGAYTLGTTYGIPATMLTDYSFMGSYGTEAIPFFAGYNGPGYESNPLGAAFAVWPDAQFVEIQGTQIGYSANTLGLNPEGGKVTVGTFINSSARLTVDGGTTTITVDDVTGLTAYQVDDASGYVSAYGYCYDFYVYGYKDTGLGRVYSANGAYTTMCDDYSTNTYYVQLSFDPISVDGYRIIVYDSNFGYYGDVSQDVADNFPAYNPYGVTYDNIVTPSSPYATTGVALNVSGDSQLQAISATRFASQNDNAANTPMVIRNAAGDKIFEMLDDGTVSYGGNAISGAFDPDWKMERTKTLLFAKFLNNQASGRTIMGVGMGSSAGAATFDLRSHGSSYSETLFGNSLTDSNAMIAQGGTNFIIGNYENQPLIFGTNNAERARILGNGNFGIGTNNPSALLEVNGNTYIRGNINMDQNRAIRTSFGTQSAPAYSFTNSTNSGMYMPDNLTLSFSANGLRSFSIYNGATRLDGGNLNLGSTGVITWGPTCASCGGHNIGLSRFDNGTLAVGNTGVGDVSGTLLAGRLGIGTNNASSKLTLSGSGAGTAQAFEIKNTAAVSGNRSWVYQLRNTPVDMLQIAPANDAGSALTAGFGMDRSGKVGIGTQTMTATFNVQGSSFLNGTINTTSSITANSYQVNGVAGLTKTVTLINASNNASCTMIYTSGLYTGGTC